MSYVKPGEAAVFYNISVSSLRNRANAGEIKFIITDGGHRRYYIKEINHERRKCVYARVSSKKQSEDLQRQVQFLSQSYPTHEVITDIGSGINYKRPGFKAILAGLFHGDIEEVVVATPDRFSRLGANELFAWIFEQFEAKLIFVSDSDDSCDFETGLGSDLMEIITVFNTRYHGKRKYSKQKDKNLSKQGTDQVV